MKSAGEVGEEEPSTSFYPRRQSATEKGAGVTTGRQWAWRSRGWGTTQLEGVEGVSQRVKNWGTRLESIIFHNQFTGLNSGPA